MKHLQNKGKTGCLLPETPQETPIITHGVVARVFLDKEHDGKHGPNDSISLFRYFLTKTLASTRKEERYEKLGVILHVITLQCLFSERFTQTHAGVYLPSFRQKHQRAPAVPGSENATSYENSRISSGWRL